MLKKFLHRQKCDHKFVLFAIYDNDDRDLVNYNFRCSHCGEEKVIINYEILDDIKEIFLEALNNQLNNHDIRLQVDIFHLSVWSLFCKKHMLDLSFKESFPYNLIELSAKNLLEITEEDVLNLNVTAYGDFVEYTLDKDRVIENGIFLIYKKFNGKYSYIDRNLVNLSVDKHVDILRQSYKSKGISKRMVEINKEALKEACKELCIQYKEAK